MKKVITLITVLAVFICSSCTKSESDKKDNTKTPTVEEGTLRFTNTSSNPYEVFISGSSYGIVSGNSFKSVSKEKGPYTLRALQKSGYVLYPTEREITVDLKAGGEIEFVFP